MSSIKTAISLDSSLLQEVDYLAKQLEISRSHLFVVAVNDFLKNYKNKKLFESINKAYEEGLTDEEKDIIEKMRNKQHKILKRNKVTD